MSDLGDWIWHSDAVWAAELDAVGCVRRAGDGIVALTGRPLVELVVAEQRAAVRARIAAAGPDWSDGPVATVDARTGTVADRVLHLRRAGDRVLAVLEPSVAEHERLVRRMLDLNVDLLEQQRELVRQREALEHERREAEAAADRLRRLEAVATAALHGESLDEVLHELLGAIRDAVSADRAAVLLAGEGGREVTLRASVGDGPAIEPVALDELRTPYLGGSYAGVPLRGRSEVIGALHVVSARRRAFAEEDLGLLQAAADRAVLAIGRAQVYEREHRIAETLQRSLLPERLPAVPGLRFAARFEPGTGVEVGGDWYDAMPLPSGDIALVIGDVAGKGVRAATVMGEVRSALRAYALDAADPRDVLAAVNRVVQRGSHMVTCSLSMLSPATGTLRTASAGHPPPLVLRADGRAEFLADGRRGPLIAYEPNGAAEAELAPGDRLLLYTDGLVERRGETLDVGLERLRSAAGGVAAADLDDLCDGVLRRALPAGGAGDDVALLAVERAV